MRSFDINHLIISDSVYDRDQKPRYGIEVILNLSRYQPALSKERINTKMNKYKYIFYNSILFIRVLSHKKINTIKLNISLNTKKSSCIYNNTIIIKYKYIYCNRNMA